MLLSIVGISSNTCTAVLILVQVLSVLAVELPSKPRARHNFDVYVAFAVAVAVAVAFAVAVAVAVMPWLQLLHDTLSRAGGTPAAVLVRCHLRLRSHWHGHPL